MAAAITTTMSTMSSASIRSEGRRPLPGTRALQAGVHLPGQACTRAGDPPTTAIVRERPRRDAGRTGRW